ncbi:GNAT family N-acetyltransferase [Sporosarcina highlanderae]|uniref:GNAT family N-acetyltransferase n=1 Tax=Sporosarcina highlanderae TaxID=3035916 RepID=A0ABT8JMT9_9BACL|nr:GNAT family N-acetyltransferase [Sporosarcina highlanderae]MDN4606357.1 GNAT family N-acetyltransferase [Sporosarcina highlanderae]
MNQHLEWTTSEFYQLGGIDVYEMLALRVAVFVVEQNCPYQEVDGHDETALHVFGKDEKGIAAYARLLPAGEKYDCPSIGRVIIRSDYRGKGVGHDLIEKCVSLIDEKWKPKQIKLQAQAHLESFYATHGFKAESEPYDEDGIPHIDMIRLSGSFQISR